MFTKILRKIVKSINYGTGHCVPDGGGSTGHCY